MEIEVRIQKRQLYLSNSLQHSNKRRPLRDMTRDHVIWYFHLAALVHTGKQPSNSAVQTQQTENKLATKVAHEPARRDAACASTGECRTRARRYPEVSLLKKKYMQQSNALCRTCITSDSRLRKATLKVIAKQYF